jgi:hypothetical protein
MIRGVHESTIRRYMRLFETEPALREANDTLLHFARSHSIVKHWGSGGPLRTIYLCDYFYAGGV